MLRNEIYEGMARRCGWGRFGPGVCFVLVSPIAAEGSQECLNHLDETLRMAV